MPHTARSIHHRLSQVGQQTGHHLKKAALFDQIHDMIVESRDECLTLGATPAQLAPFTETIALFEANKAAILSAVDLT